MDIFQGPAPLYCVQSGRSKPAGSPKVSGMPNSAGLQFSIWPYSSRPLSPTLTAASIALASASSWTPCTQKPEGRTRIGRNLNAPPKQTGAVQAAGQPQFLHFRTLRVFGALPPWSRSRQQGREEVPNEQERRIPKEPRPKDRTGKGGGNTALPHEGRTHERNLHPFYAARPGQSRISWKSAQRFGRWGSRIRGRSPLA